MKRIFCGIIIILMLSGCRYFSSKPAIYAEDRTINLGESFDALEGVSAHDRVDGDVEVTIISYNVNSFLPGEYSVTYRAEDSENNVTEKTIKITVLYSQVIYNHKLYSNFY